MLNLPEDPLEREFKSGIKRQMPQIVIEVISVTPPTFVKTPRGGYNQLEVAFKKNGKVEGKKILDFVNQTVFSTLKSAKQGDKLSVTVEKDEKNFLQWTAVGPASEGDQQATGEAQSENSGAQTGSSGASNAVASPGRGRVTGSNYESADERADRRKFERIKHRQIGRQGCINSAIAFMNANFKEVTKEDIVETAEFFEQWVFSKIEE